MRSRNKLLIVKVLQIGLSQLKFQEKKIQLPLLTDRSLAPQSPAVALWPQDPKGNKRVVHER
jgi:hypothetical protein